MVRGVTLSLMIGPMVPLPVGKEVLEALEKVRVTTSTRGASGFELAFTLSNRSPLHTLFLLSGGGPIPLMRVIIVVTVKGQSQVLIDGVMTEHSVQPGDGAGRSRLTVVGEDLSRAMDHVDFDGIPYPAMPIEARVALVVAKYAMFGLIPLVIPSVLIDVPIPVERIPRHQGTDLEYLHQLAEEVGYVFYVAPGPVPGINFAYWGPEVRVGVPQPALNINMDAHTNVESLSFDFDSQSGKLPIVWIHPKLTKVPIPIPVPNVSLLNPPLGAVPPLPLRVEQLSGTGSQTPIQAALFGLKEASRASDAVTGRGSLDVMRYGRVLKARELVGVRGAGQAFDGLHYVDSVTHEIERGRYTQSFTLVRNGLISTLPRVPA